MRILSGKLCIVLLLSGLLPAGLHAQRGDNLSWVDPTIGNAGWLLQPTRPTVQLPHQVMRVYPIRADYMDDQISAFPLLIVSHRLGQVFSIKPINGKAGPATWDHKMTFDHDLEINRPWYYETQLVDDDIKVSFVPGKKAGIYRFAFRRKGEKVLAFDVFNKGANELQQIDPLTLQGYETYHDNIRIYLYGTFNVPGRLAGEGSGGKATLSFGASGADSIEFRYAISFVSQQQAKQNYQDELATTNFEKLQQAAFTAWDRVFSQVNVEGGTPAQRRSFYTALYRCNERMVDITEGKQYFSGFDNKVHPANGPFYVDDWTWDTYLALHPLRCILDPKMEGQMAASFLDMYRQSGWLPTFPVLFGDHACMNGFHSSVMLLDDYRKGIRSFDIELAYEAMKKNATQATMLPWRNGPKGELEEVYYDKGFYPALPPGQKETVAAVHPFEKRQAVAVTLGTSYDDWAVASLAKELGKTEDATLFTRRAGNYRTLWNDSLQMFMPKDAGGNWIYIDPKIDGGKGGREYYDENNGWTYLWQVQHDVGGLMKLMGGQQNFENKLDQLFREKLGRSKYEFWNTFPDATGLVGQFSMGNEPSFHIPYLYNFTQSPWKTQKHIRFLLDTWFKDNIFGIPGDEDGGGMSAFVVFSSMGFYPLTPGNPRYTIGSPVFSKVQLQLQNGKTFTLIANKASVVNKYIQSARMNGKPLNEPWFTHDQLMNGGTLELEMGPLPNKQWGVQSPVAVSDPVHPDYATAPVQEWEKKFTGFSFRKLEENNHVLPYRFYQPGNTDPKKKYPLVLFFHGAGERGADNRKQFLRFPTVQFWETTPCYIIAPQCPEPPKGGPDGEAVWVQTGFGWPSHNMKDKPSWPLQLSMQLLDSVIRQYNIDTNRIYVTGLSMGGFATWEILQREGERFAAAVPVCGGADTAYAAKMTRIPIWAFHGDADSTVLPGRSIAMIKAIEHNGGKQAKLTIYPGVGHGAWTPTYSNPEVWNWLFAHTKHPALKP
jgi:predicted alpha-1,2-mannosidase